MSKVDITISKKEILEYEKLKLISELTLINEKTKYFEKKYSCSFNEFENKFSGDQKEKFEEWDDYIEWKAYFKKQEELEQKREQFKNVQDIRITEDS